LARTNLPLVAYGPRPPPPSVSIPYRGFLSEDEMRVFLSGAAATLFLFDYEALGLVPFESLAAGTPVITLPKQGPHRTLSHNRDVYFGRDVGELRELCARILQSPPTRADRARCRESVEVYKSSESARSFQALMERLTKSRS
ncbi:glycosyltransferase, partial [mine drainage metagenome]